MKKLTLLFTAFLTAFLLALPVHAADITLNSRCALADAIIAANSDRAEGGCPAGRGADAITLNQDITLRAALPAITSEITIEGNGYTISGDNRYRIFYNDGGALTIHNLTLIEGRVEGLPILNADATLKATTAQPFGGAIRNWKGTLSITNSSFSGNVAAAGGAISNWKEGKLSIRGSTFSDNWAGNGHTYGNAEEISISDSASWAVVATVGGAILNMGELSIVSSTFSDNRAGEGIAITNWMGKLSISDSTFSDNRDWAFSRLIRYGGGKLSIVNSMFSDNLWEEFITLLEDG